MKVLFRVTAILCGLHALALFGLVYVVVLSVDIKSSTGDWTMWNAIALMLIMSVIFGALAWAIWEFFLRLRP